MVAVSSRFRSVRSIRTNVIRFKEVSLRKKSCHIRIYVCDFIWRTLSFLWNTVRTINYAQSSRKFANLAAVNKSTRVFKGCKTVKRIFSFMQLILAKFDNFLIKIISLDIGNVLWNIFFAWNLKLLYKNQSSIIVSANSTYGVISNCEAHFNLYEFINIQYFQY